MIWRRSFYNIFLCDFWSFVIKSDDLVTKRSSFLTQWLQEQTQIALHVFDHIESMVYLHRKLIHHAHHAPDLLYDCSRWGYNNNTTGMGRHASQHPRSFINHFGKLIFEEQKIINTKCKHWYSYNIACWLSKSQLHKFIIPFQTKRGVIPLNGKVSVSAKMIDEGGKISEPPTFSNHLECKLHWTGLHLYCWIWIALWQKGWCIYIHCI